MSCFSNLRIIALAVFIAGFVTLASAQAQEQGSILFVSPYRVVAEPDARVQVINVANKSDKTHRYDISVVDQVMDENGMTQRKDTFEYSAKDMLQFNPKRFTLEAGARQTIRLLIKRPKDLKDGDYHSHLLFREVPLSRNDAKKTETSEADKGKATFEIRTLYGVAVPVIVQQGKVESGIEISGVRVLPAEQGNDIKRIAVDFNRTGNAEAAAKLSVSYVGGKEPVEAIDPQWVRVYREVSKITKTIPMAGLPKDARGGKLVLSLIKDEDKPELTVTQEVPLP